MNRRKTDWILYDWNVNGVDRKTTIQKLVEAGMSARDAISEIREIESRDEIPLAVQ